MLSIDLPSQNFLLDIVIDYLSNFSNHVQVFTNSNISFRPVKFPDLIFFASRRIAKSSPLSRDIFLPEGSFLRGHRLKASINHRATGQSFTKETFEVSELPWPK